MKGARAWWLYALLLVVALAAGLGVGADGGTPTTPSIHNAGPRGAAVVFTWMREAGVDVREQIAPLTELPPDAATLVVAAPTAREVSEEEVAALQRFVEAGGTLIYLSPRPRLAQPAMASWLALHEGPLPELTDELGVQDVGGSTVGVRFPGDLAAHLTRLRVAGERSIEVQVPEAVPVAEAGAVWWLKLGAGQIFIGGGPDLIENARLELLDNAAFWQNVASRGPVVFDEGHHDASLRPGPARNLVASLLQFFFCALLLAWAVGARLGPPRPTDTSRHRAATEYVEALAGLAQDAGLEAEGVTALQAEAKRLLCDALGLPPSADWEEAALAAQRRGLLEAEAVRALAADTDFLSLSQRVARLANDLAGRA